MSAHLILLLNSVESREYKFLGPFSGSVEAHAYGAQNLSNRNEPYQVWPMIEPGGVLYPEVIDNGCGPAVAMIDHNRDRRANK